MRAFGIQRRAKMVVGELRGIHAVLQFTGDRRGDVEGRAVATAPLWPVATKPACAGSRDPTPYMVPLLFLKLQNATGNTVPYFVALADIRLPTRVSRALQDAIRPGYHATRRVWKPLSLWGRGQSVNWFTCPEAD
jgi:hypothetical protein